MIDIANLTAVGIAFSIVAASPGPANIANATIAMQHGRRASLKFGTGLSVSVTMWGVLAVLGMGALLQTSVVLLTALKVFGGLYLLWLALHSARSAIRPMPLAVAKSAGKNWFLRGLILNLSNPKAILVWMAAISVGLDAENTSGSILVSGALCVFLIFLNNFLYSLAFSTNGMMAIYERARRWIDGVVAGMFAIAGLGMLKSAFSK